MVRGFLADRSARPDIETALLVVSELVTNAVRHRAPGDSRSIELRVDMDALLLHVEVQDHNVGQPEISSAAKAGGGRGLFILDHVCSNWGWMPVVGNGKRVWCDLPPFGT